MRESYALRHFSINTEKSYVHWLGRYGGFLKHPKLKDLRSEKKMEAFLTHLALSGVSASTQNQSFNALLLRIKDIDLKQGKLYIHRSKGNKRSVVLFPDCLREPL